jgi:hypothetical protein
MAAVDYATEPRIKRARSRTTDEENAVLGRCRREHGCRGVRHRVDVLSTRGDRLRVLWKLIRRVRTIEAFWESDEIRAAARGLRDRRARGSKVRRLVRAARELQQREARASGRNRRSARSTHRTQLKLSARKNFYCRTKEKSKEERALRFVLARFLSSKLW